MKNPRADYLPIIDRKPLRLPRGGRVAVWVIVNVEEWDINAPMARTVLPFPQGVTAIPDVANYGWYEYGLRVGFWRMRELFERRGGPGTVALTASLCLSYPAVVAAMVESGWEIMGHGFLQRALPLEPDERAVIRRTIDTI